jgi:hypothetical protein
VADALERGGTPDDPIARYFTQLAGTPDADPLALAAQLRPERRDYRLYRERAAKAA